MEYLLIDARQRFLGTMKCDRTLGVGDTFQGDNAKTYAVVGVNWANRRTNPIDATSLTQHLALTVVAVHHSPQPTQS